MHMKLSQVTSTLMLLIVSLVVATPRTDADVLKAIVKKIGKVADDIPLSKIDDALRNPNIAKQGRDLLETTARQSDEALSSRNAVRRLLEKSGEAVDPVVLKQLDNLDDAGMSVVYVVSKGTGSVGEAVPDLLTRTRFIADGGADTLATIGRHSDLMNDALDFQVMVKAGQVTSKTGQKVTLQTFGEFFQKTGDKGRRFWVKYVRPHPKKWLAGGALAAILLTPDEYLDEAGDLLAAGIEKLPREIGELAGKISSAAVTGAGEGAASFMEKTVVSVLKTWLLSFWGVVAGVVAVFLVFPKSFHWLRNRVMGLFRRNPSE